jgi:hypothetical protein
MGSENTDDADCQDGHDLARFLLANSEGHLPASTPAAHDDAQATCHATSIVVELAFKAFLVSRGWTDDRCRVELRHDLTKALAGARACCLADEPAALDRTVSVLNTYYPQHAFYRFVVPADDPTFPWRARETAARLVEMVRRSVEQRRMP